MEPQSQAIVFIDGHCNLCNSTADILIRLDRKRRLQYAPIQGQTGARLLDPEKIRVIESIIYWQDGQIYERSRAVGKILVRMGGIYALLGYLVLIVPRFIADPLYMLIANNRYRLFGRRDTCRLPTPEEKELFLD